MSETVRAAARDGGRSGGRRLAREEYGPRAPSKMMRRGSACSEFSFERGDSLAVVLQYPSVILQCLVRAEPHFANAPLDALERRAVSFRSLPHLVAHVFEIDLRSHGSKLLAECFEIGFGGKCALEPIESLVDGPEPIFGEPFECL
jgi:hypothetical protein